MKFNIHWRAGYRCVSFFSKCESGQGPVWDLFTFLGHLRPLWVGEFILAHPDPPLHPWRNGLARVGIKWGEATQPRERGTFKIKKKKSPTPTCQLFLSKMQAHISGGINRAPHLVLTGCTWWHQETTCHMTCHISLGPKSQELISAKHKHMDTDRKLEMKMGQKWPQHFFSYF